MARFLIIAAGSGIGKSVVEEVQANGHKVITTARNSLKIIPDVIL